MAEVRDVRTRSRSAAPPRAVQIPFQEQKLSNALRRLYLECGGHSWRYAARWPDIGINAVRGECFLPSAKFSQEPPEQHEIAEALKLSKLDLMHGGLGLIDEIHMEDAKDGEKGGLPSKEQCKEALRLKIRFEGSRLERQRIQLGHKVHVTPAENYPRPTGTIIRYNGAGRYDIKFDAEYDIDRNLIKEGGTREVSVENIIIFDEYTIGEAVQIFEPGVGWFDGKILKRNDVVQKMLKRGQSRSRSYADDTASAEPSYTVKYDNGTGERTDRDVKVRNIRKLRFQEWGDAPNPRQWFGIKMKPGKVVAGQKWFTLTELRLPHNKLIFARSVQFQLKEQSSARDAEPSTDAERAASSSRMRSRASLFDDLVEAAPQLEVLDLTDADFDDYPGGFPYDPLAKLTELRVLNLSWCGFEGGESKPSPAQASRLFGRLLAALAYKLQELHLSQCGLSGNLPDEILGMSALKVLRLDNNSLSGELFPALERDNNSQPWGLVQLRMLDLSHNRLSGYVPRALCQATTSFTHQHYFKVLPQAGDLLAFDPTFAAFSPPSGLELRKEKAMFVVDLSLLFSEDYLTEWLKQGEAQLMSADGKCPEGIAPDHIVPISHEDAKDKLLVKNAWPLPYDSSKGKAAAASYQHRTPEPRVFIDGHGIVDARHVAYISAPVLHKAIVRLTQAHEELDQKRRDMGKPKRPKQRVSGDGKLHEHTWKAWRDGRNELLRLKEAFDETLLQTPLTRGKGKMLDPNIGPPPKFAFIECLCVPNGVSVPGGDVAEARDCRLQALMSLPGIIKTCGRFVVLAGQFEAAIQDAWFRLEMLIAGAPVKQLQPGQHGLQRLQWTHSPARREPEDAHDMRSSMLTIEKSDSTVGMAPGAYSAERAKAMIMDPLALTDEQSHKKRIGAHAGAQLSDSLRRAVAAYDLPDKASDDLEERFIYKCNIQRLSYKGADAYAAWGRDEDPALDALVHLTEAACVQFQTCSDHSVATFDDGDTFDEGDEDAAEDADASNGGEDEATVDKNSYEYQVRKLSRSTATRGKLFDARDCQKFQEIAYRVIEAKYWKQPVPKDAHSHSSMARTRADSDARATAGAAELVSQLTPELAVEQAISVCKAARRAAARAADRAQRAFEKVDELENGMDEQGRPNRYDLAVLQKSCPEGVDPARKDVKLKTVCFEEAFGVSRERFYRLDMRTQRQLKIKARLN